MRDPDDLSDADKGFRELSKHLVSLSCSHFVTKDRSGPRYFIISGFLVSMNDNWYLATASHVLAQIDQEMKKHPERTYTFFIVDHLGPESKYKLSIPFDYRNSVRYRNKDEAIGADFGLVHIDLFYRRQMEANPQTPIDERNWRIEKDFDPVAHIILGIPYEGVSPVSDVVVGRDTTNYQRFEITGLQVRQIPEPPEGISDLAYPTFWAELGTTELKSIEGMSGCPILAFGKTKAGEVKYGVVAVQAGWYHERMPRIIYGGDFRSLMHDAEVYFDQHAERLPSKW
jgi:hypothetical protein